MVEETCKRSWWWCDLWEGADRDFCLSSQQFSRGFWWKVIIKGVAVWPSSVGNIRGLAFCDAESCSLAWVALHLLKIIKCSVFINEGSLNGYFMLPSMDHCFAGCWYLDDDWELLSSVQSLMESLKKMKNKTLELFSICHKLRGFGILSLLLFQILVIFSEGVDSYLFSRQITYIPEQFMKAILLKLFSKSDSVLI